MLKSRTMSPAEISQNAGADAVFQHPDAGGRAQEAAGEVQVVLAQGKVQQVEQHSYTQWPEDGGQTGAEHAHAQLHGKDIVQHDVADVAGVVPAIITRPGVAVRPDDDAQGAGEDIGKGEQVDGAHIVHHFGEDDGRWRRRPGPAARWTAEVSRVRVRPTTASSAIDWVKTRSASGGSAPVR